MAATPTRRKKRLGQRLERLRTRADKSLSDAAAALRMHKSVVSRYESGLVRPSWTGLQTLLALYAASDDERAEAKEIWEDAEPKSGTRITAPRGSSVAFRAFLRAEAEASEELMLEPQVIPGLLQTERYARAINEGGRQFHVAEPEQYVATRLNRHQRLSGENPLHIHALIDEAAICRIVGNVSIMIDQLEYLLTVSQWENVTLQIIPFDAGVYGNMCGEFIILKYPESEDPPAIYATHVAGGVWIENENDVQRFLDLYEEVTERAASPDDSRKIIQSQLGKLKNNDSP